MDWDINKLQMINNPPCSAHQASEQQKILDRINAEQRRKDNAILQTAQASIEQKELLEKQLEEVKQQNAQLKKTMLYLKIYTIGQSKMLKKAQKMPREIEFLVGCHL